MRKVLRCGICLVLAAVLCLGLLLPAFAADQQATILFTHDLHSHLLPAMDQDGGEYGGYARLMTVIRQQKERYPDAILVDAGDFSMGSLFQTAYPTAAIELRMMGAMGYDATTFGNHEFDYLPSGLGAMLNAAADCGEPVPAIVDANYWPGDHKDAAFVRSAMDNYGVKEYILLERGGVVFALFGLVGLDSNDCAPNSGMVLEAPEAAAQRVVDAARREALAVYGMEPVVIALSHSGTSGGKGEDYELAKAVEGIDLIVSGHTHTTLPEPVVVGDTWIVSAAEYGKYLGVVQMSQAADGTARLTDYQLIPVNEQVAEDPEIARRVEGFKADVERDYLSAYGLTFDQVLTENSYEFDSVRDVYDYPHESTLGNVFSDAYLWAAEKTLGHRVDLAVTASGVIRESIPVGPVTVSDVFNAASLGVGTEGELVEIYATGADLKTILEVDASVYPLMHSAQLFSSGVEYTYNRNRMIFNKVDYAAFRRPDGTVEEIQDDKLYCIVTGMYMAQMLGSVEETSMGLLTLVPRDKNGDPVAVEDFAQYVIRDENGRALKEWFAIASYLQEMGGEMDEGYAAPDGRKVVYSSLNPVKLLRNANRFTGIVLAVIGLVLALAVLTVWTVRRKLRKRKG